MIITASVCALLAFVSVTTFLFLSLEFKKKLLEKKPKETEADKTPQKENSVRSTAAIDNTQKKTTTAPIPNVVDKKKDIIYSSYQTNMNLVLVLMTTVVSLYFTSFLNF